MKNSQLAALGFQLDRVATVFCWTVMIFALGFFAGAIVTAYVRGAFQAVVR